MLFESPPLSLSELLDDIHVGKIQLPDFQRPWKWDDERIISLLATVTLGYPLGVVMTLAHRRTWNRFKPRPLSGSHVPPGTEPAELLMDGQQRMTSLYQALRSGGPVETTDSRGRPITRWYYLDIESALNDLASREDVILSVPADRKFPVPGDRKQILDLTTQAAECEAGMFPLRIAFDQEALTSGSATMSTSNPSRWGIWGPFQSQVLKNISDYRLPVIRLAHETPKEAVCTVFEKVNTGGVPLNVFELLTATYAGDTEYFNAHGVGLPAPRALEAGAGRASRASHAARRGQRLPAGRLSGLDAPPAAGPTGRRPVHAACGQLQARRHPGPPAAGVHQLVAADRVGAALDRRLPRPPGGLR